jgi:hypothetical protein
MGAPYMDMHSAKTRSIVLLRAACDAGASAQAMDVIKASSFEVDSIVPWPRLVLQLEALLASHHVDVRQVVDSNADVQKAR